MFGKLEAELEIEEQKGKQNKTMNFLIRIMPKVIASITVFLGFIWIFNQIYDKYGIDKIIIIFGVIMMLNLRGISKTLNQVN